MPFGVRRAVIRDAASSGQRTDRQTDRQTYRQTNRHTQTDDKTNIQIAASSGQRTDRPTDRQTDRQLIAANPVQQIQTDRHTDRQTDTPTNTQIDGQTNIQIAVPSGQRTDRRTDRQTTHCRQPSPKLTSVFGGAHLTPPPYAMLFGVHRCVLFLLYPMSVCGFPTLSRGGGVGGGRPNKTQVKFRT